MTARPAIITIDDEPEVLRAVERDLKQRYATEYRVVAAASGESALDALKELKLRGDPVALMLVDQRMPQMNGVEFIEEALEIFPEAKRALLTAYADTDAAIRAINDVSADYYLLKPWDPPEDKLYPVLDDMLEDWWGSFRPRFEGVRVVGHRWSAEGHRIRDFLGRNQIPYRWLDVETSDEVSELLFAVGDDAVRLPLVVLDDGRVLHAPTVSEVAALVGLKAHAELPFYDLIVVGGGPAGLAGAVYGASEGLKTLMVEREAPGGQAGTSARIENYLGFPSGLSGSDLARRGLAQARRLGAEILTPSEVVSLRVEDGYKVLSFADGQEVSGRALVLSSGVTYRKLAAAGADRLTGAGVYYGAAASEATSVKGEDVYIVGGANSAGQAAVFFAGHARSVTMLVRGPSIDSAMSTYLTERIRSTDNINVLPDTEVVAVDGGDHLEKITIRRKDDTEETVSAAGLFVFIGAIPHTEWLEGLLERDEYGFIVTGGDLPVGALSRWPLERAPFLLETNVPGLFAAGDVRHASVKRVASAVGEGAAAVMFVHQYLAEA